jgi:hypothetical protein
MPAGNGLCTPSSSKTTTPSVATAASHASSALSWSWRRPAGIRHTVLRAREREQAHHPPQNASGCWWMRRNAAYF